MVRRINHLIGFLVLAALACVYWFAYRPLPQTSGSVAAPISANAAVARDSLGVPHIQAASEPDALFVQGYATAQDRLWQMDGLRRLASGELAEIFGSSYLESDRESRRLRMRHLAEAAYENMPAADRAQLAAYARGVNYFIDTHRGNLPVEFTLLRYQPRPWSVIDSILVGLHMFRILTTTWRDDLLKRNMLASGDPAKVNLLFPSRSSGEVQPGSNAWALAGVHTASGRPLLANDMHLDFTFPGIWYMTHLQAPGLNVSGVCVPGAPGVIAGHNDRIAWGLTNLHYDVQDLYIEKFDERTGRYEFSGGVEQARPEREFILVKGEKTVEFSNWITRHGPLFSQGGEHLALRWVAAEPGLVQFPFVEIDRARNWTEFQRAIERFAGPAQNFVYADVDGNIGYHAAGKLPIRKSFTGDVPVDGKSGLFEWQGFIPFDDLPHSFNPPSGIIVSANQNPFASDYGYTVNGGFAPPYRAREIRAVLAQENGWRAADMIAVQKDVYSAFSKFLADELVKACEKRKVTNPQLAPAIALLRQWNGQMEKDQAAPFVIALAFQHLRRALAQVASPQHGALYDAAAAPAVIENLLRARPPGWFRDYDEALVRSLDDAVDEARRIQGRNPNNWRYGRYVEVTLIKPLAGQLKWIGKYFNIGPVEMSGSSTTIKQTTQRMGPSMRMNADLGDWDRSLLNITIGQSGQVFSGHYKDQWEAYYAGRSFPMQFEKIAAKDVLRFTPAP